jgi:hypothetical protein
LGVPDIVLDRLTTVDGLTVVARDSAFRAGEESADPAEISQRLRAASWSTAPSNAAARCCVFRRGSSMRAQQGRLWSTRYDRPIEDLFAMQDDIATQVATALNDRISGMRAPEAAAARPAISRRTSRGCAVARSPAATRRRRRMPQQSSSSRRSRRSRICGRLCGAL